MTTRKKKKKKEEEEEARRRNVCLNFKPEVFVYSLVFKIVNDSNLYFNGYAMYPV